MGIGSRDWRLQKRDHRGPVWAATILLRCRSRPCFEFQVQIRVPGSRFWVPGFEFRVPGPGFRVAASGFRVPGFRFGVSGSEFQVSGKDEQPPWGLLSGGLRDKPLRLLFSISEDFGVRAAGSGFVGKRVGLGTPTTVLFTRSYVKMSNQTFRVYEGSIVAPGKS